MAEPSCLINCTIPVKLRDFLKENGINRSALFREAALKMYEHKICPSCYSSNIADTYKGIICQDCSKWLLQKECPICKIPFTPTINGNPAPNNPDVYLCNECWNIGAESLNDWFNTTLSKKLVGDKDDKK